MNPREEMDAIVLGLNNEGLTQQEIGDRLRLNQGTICKCLQRLRKKGIAVKITPPKQPKRLADDILLKYSIYLNEQEKARDNNELPENKTE